MTEPASASPVTRVAARQGRSGLRWAARAAMMLGGLVAGLAIAEAAFYYRDGGAFPHLNVYVADAALGVRLAPGATERIAFGGNPPTEVRINADGYRGAELPPPGSDEVLVVGDSQVFGLGVEERETFSAVLGGALDRTVVNAGVPTYGPAEYRAVIAEQLAKRHPRTVVLTINLANDLFEAQHPNLERHAVWDGWAVRKETAPASITQFPGRDLLFRRSHLFFALRKWRHADDRADERGVASEGTWRDLVTTGARVRDDRRALDDARHKRLAALSDAHEQVETAERAIDGKIRAILGTPEGLPLAYASAGDIVNAPAAESSRATVVTAELIARAAAARARLRAELARWAEAHDGDDALAARTTLAAGDQAFGALTALDAQRLQAMLEPPLGGYLREVQQLVEHGGARLVVLILPLDVQVSATEWKKYGAQPIDMAPTAALTAELLEHCRALGVSALDATPVLAGAEPGAFLDHDLHMTPRGHAAVASALAAMLAEQPPRRRTVSPRSPVAVPDLWRQAAELPVAGAGEARCEVKRVREWLRVLCVGSLRTHPRDVQITRDDGHEASALVMPDGVSLLVPVLEGTALEATVRWNDRSRVFTVAWPSGEARPTIAFAAARGDDDELVATGSFRSDTERAICSCWQVVFGDHRPKGDLRRFDNPRCPAAYGFPDPACVERYFGTDVTCPEFLACTRRDPSSPP